MMISKLLVLFLFVNLSHLYCQVIINDTSTSESSAFSVTSNDKGILISKVSLPSVTTIQLDGINTAAEGLLIYNTNELVIEGDGKGFYYFNTALGKWEKILTPKSTVGVFPIGSIIPWHNRIDFPTLTLSEGWQLCDGSLISDTDSPLAGLSTPNLNGNTTSTSGDTSSGRYLRGSVTSGVYQSDQTNNLFRILASGSSGTTTNLILNQYGGTGYLITDDWNGNGFSRDRYGFQLRGVETRVANMSVLYIMRIK
ncbi:hypothetical protein ACFQO1_12265 [Jejudonia soesokkakensis]|uniref:Phage tail collar domain-containing protein n=1 Tax=Jejudonia soesokkakensis TaxID=1323432 RepID=A0ABW2MXG6_9FLAO